MSEITRDEISQVLRDAQVDADTVEGRNAQRRQAVELFLVQRGGNHMGTQGTAHEMILSDLSSYREWEVDASASESARAQLAARAPWRPKEL